MNINICLSADENYIKYAGVVIASVLKNAKVSDTYKIFILTDGVSDESRAEILSLSGLKENSEIKIVEISPKDFEDYSSASTHEYLSMATFYRLKIASLLPELEKIIYLDCDIVVRRDIAELFDIDLGKNIAGGIRDVAAKKMTKRDKLESNAHYINGGVVIFDCKKMRDENIESKFLEYVKTNGDSIRLGDQQIINYVLQGRIKEIDSLWNVQVSNFVGRSNYTMNPYIIHYTAKNKPWIYGSWTFFRGEYFKYLQCTPWAIPESEKFKWRVNSRILGIFRYIKYRPLFFLRPKFYKALLLTYIPFFNRRNK